MRLVSVAGQISRHRFKVDRKVFHVVDSDKVLTGNQNSLWKLQPVFTQVKDAWDKLERQRSFYLINH